MKRLFCTAALLSVFAAAPSRALEIDLNSFTNFSEASAIARTYEYVAPKVLASNANVFDGNSFVPACQTGLFAITQNFASFCQSTTTAQLSFIGVGDDGTTLSTEAMASNALLKNMLSSNRPDLRIRVTWKLKSCDTVPMDATEDSDDLETAIRMLRKYDFQQYMSCTFDAVTIAASEKADGLLMYETYVTSLTVLDNDDLQIQSPQPIYFTRRVDPLPAAEAAATAAAGQFADIVKGYGALLVDLRDAPNSDRKASLLAYLAQNKPVLIAALQTIDRQLPACGTMTKLNVNFTIKRAYAFVRTLEAKILGNYPFGDIVGHGY